MTPHRGTRSRPAPTSWRSSAPTIHAVARRAGVSSATVSRVLSGTKFVSRDLADRVARAVKELDYRPNHVARNLRARATSTVGVVIPDIENPFFTSVVRGIEDALQARRFTLLLANSDGDPDRERVCLDTLCAEGVAGLIFVPCNSEPLAYQHLTRQGVPLVAVDRSPADLDVDLVCVSNEEGARQAVRHLIALGWRSVALIGGPPTTNVAVERERGYQQALAESGLSVRPGLVQRADFKEEGGYRAMQALLESAPGLRAVFVANNLMAMGALRALADRSLRVPEDVALALFDDIPWAARLCPPLTAVAQPTYDLGVSAAQVLLDRITEPARPVRRVALKTDLIVRASCGARLPEAARLPVAENEQTARPSAPASRGER
jgi:DNA-binding LacI/PurR family transcriptional regulator